jgi:hypothetical protein
VIKQRPSSGRSKKKASTANRVEYFVGDISSIHIHKTLDDIDTTQKHPPKKESVVTFSPFDNKTEKIDYYDFGKVSRNKF